MSAVPEVVRASTLATLTLSLTTREIIRKMSPRQEQKKTIFQSSADTSPKQVAQSPHKENYLYCWCHPAVKHGRTQRNSPTSGKGRPYGHAESYFGENRPMHASRPAS